MKIDKIQLLIIFDELMPATDEEQGVYWFKTLRPDGLIITFSFSTYEAYVDVIIHNTSKVDIASVRTYPHIPNTFLINKISVPSTSSGLSLKTLPSISSFFPSALPDDGTFSVTMLSLSQLSNAFSPSTLYFLPYDCLFYDTE